jgi:hypothetical protein
MRKRLAGATLILASSTPGLLGCAHTHIGADGSRHVIGLVWLTLPPPSFDAAADGLRVRTVGLSGLSTQEGSALVLGYSDTNIFTVNDDRVVNASRLLGRPH